MIFVAASIAGATLLMAGYVFHPNRECVCSFQRRLRSWPRRR